LTDLNIKFVIEGSIDLTEESFNKNRKKITKVADLYDYLKYALHDGWNEEFGNDPELYVSRMELETTMV
jgi:hypothetical protein